QEALSHLDRAVQAGLGAGDLQYVSFASCLAAAGALSVGDDLRACLERIDRYASLLDRIGAASGPVCLRIARQVIKNLTGATTHRWTMSDAVVDEAALEATVRGPGFQVVDTFYDVMKLEVLYLHGDHAGALTAARRADATGARSQGMIFATDLSFYA